MVSKPCFGSLTIFKVFFGYLIQFFLQQEIPYILAGIQHIDHEERPSNLHVLKGGVGQSFVDIKLESQRGKGINSTFLFYFQITPISSIHP